MAIKSSVTFQVDKLTLTDNGRPAAECMLWNIKDWSWLVQIFGAAKRNTGD